MDLLLNFLACSAVYKESKEDDKKDNEADNSNLLPPLKKRRD